MAALSGDDRRATELRFGLLRAVDTATARHQEVFAVIAAAEDRDAARSAIQELLQLDRPQAEAVLALQWDRLTQQNVRALAHEVARLEAELSV